MMCQSVARVIIGMQIWARSRLSSRVDNYQLATKNLSETPQKEQYLCGDPLEQMEDG